MRVTNRSTGIILGGEPRIDFLPPEIKAGNQARKTRRSLLVLVLAVVAVCVAGYVFATTLAVQSQAKLAEEQAQTQKLLAEQAQYSEVRTVSGETVAVEHARLVGSATEVVWADYLAELQASLPAGAIIETFLVDSQAALEPAPEVAVPLQATRVATITFSVRVGSLPVADSLLVNLRDLTGYSGAVVTTIELEEDGTYLANGVLHVNSDAFERRFFEDVDATTDEPDASSSDEPAEGEGQP